MKKIKANIKEGEHAQTAVITVIGKDRVGIIAAASNLLANANINIMDISQTILQNVFTMIMLVGLPEGFHEFVDVNKRLSELGNELELSITMQHSDVFNTMHRI